MINSASYTNARSESSIEVLTLGDVCTCANKVLVSSHYLGSGLSTCKSGMPNSICSLNMKHV